MLSHPGESASNSVELQPTATPHKDPLPPVSANPTPTELRGSPHAQKPEVLHLVNSHPSAVRELKLLRALLDHSHDAIQVIEPGTLRLLDVNERTCVELGYSREELLGMTIYDIAPEFDRESRDDLLRQLEQSGFAIIERVHRRKDGTTFPAEVILREVQLDRKYGVAVSRDITSRIQAKALLEDSERRFRALHQRAPVGITLADSVTGRFLQVNPRFCEIVGRSEEQILQLGFRDLTHPEDLAKSGAYFQHLAQENAPLYDLEKRYLRPDGSVAWVNLSVVPMGKLGKGPRSNMGIMQDITERKRAEESMRESEAQMRLFFEHAPTGLAMFDREMRYIHCSHRWRTDYGLGDRELRGVSHYDVFPQLPVRWKQVHSRCLEGEVIREESDRFDRADGSTQWLRWEVRPWHDKNGGVGGIVIFAEDITDSKRIEEELRQAKERLTEEKLYLEQEIDTQLGFRDLIGQSDALQAVMKSVGKVAASGATVLLLGETGTGKELVARAIHRLSHRSGNPFIKMNCAAIPSGLLESELFGNEKGAFTGAVSKKIGRLELANNGTLFLDEIGEISYELQPKLLRVLQDHEFERLGGTQTIESDFRLIAATNRDLAESVREHEFRSDLYYRLNVFPIHLPPLRDRRDDIPLLVEYFVQKCARRMNKSIISIPQKTMSALTSWDWPGNIRELENFVERSVILTNGSVLSAPLGQLQPTAGDTGENEDETLEGKEREHILRALHESQGQISGTRGAAARLGLKRTTLQSKLKRMGIYPRVPPPQA
ncbi:MAG: sigma 54-interacting transcriptional regulator [Terriglobales bacterium]